MQKQFINRNKLLGLMAESRLTQKTLSNLLRISEQSMTAKINGQPFNEREIAYLVEIFGNDIFL
jgi:DNA-binding XRE family transcriptional regulator